MLLPKSICKLCCLFQELVECWHTLRSALGVFYAERIAWRMFLEWLAALDLGRARPKTQSSFVCCYFHSELRVSYHRAAWLQRLSLHTDGDRALRFAVLPRVQY